MTDDGTPKLSWQHAWDYGIETGRYILVGERGGDWRHAVLQIGPNFDTAPLHTDPRIAIEQQILDNMLRKHQERQESADPASETEE
jgi:hypothetical protein